MISEMPTMPSLPTTATSADEPSRVMYDSETTAVVGNTTEAGVLPDSNSTWA